MLGSVGTYLCARWRSRRRRAECTPKRRSVENRHQLESPGAVRNHGTVQRPGTAWATVHARLVERSEQLAARFQRQNTSRGRAIQWLPTFARMTGSKRRRTHIARRERSMGATVRPHHAADLEEPASRPAR